MKATPSILILFTVLSFLLFSCTVTKNDGSSLSSESSSINLGNTTGLKLDLKLKAADTTPSLKLKVDLKSANDFDWHTNGPNGLYANNHAYYILQVFMQDSTNSTVPVDNFNIYFVLGQIDNSFGSWFLSTSKLFSSPRSIAPPVFFHDAESDSAETYTHWNTLNETNADGHGSKNLVFRTDGDHFYGLLSTFYTNSGVIGCSATKIHFNTNTGDIHLSLAQGQDYLPGNTMTGSYSVRAVIDGNFKTHQFFVSEETPKGSGFLKIIGYGISQDVSNSSNYYVVHISDPDNVYGPNYAGFYQIPASASEYYFEAMYTNTNMQPVTNLALMVNDTNGYSAILTNMMALYGVSNTHPLSYTNFTSNASLGL